MHGDIGLPVRGIIDKEGANQASRKRALEDQNESNGVIMSAMYFTKRDKGVHMFHLRETMARIFSRKRM